jgi:hypothetical protein
MKGLAVHKIGFISVFTVFVLLSTTLFAVSFSNKSYLTGQSPQAIVSATLIVMDIPIS